MTDIVYKQREERDLLSMKPYVDRWQSHDTRDVMQSPLIKLIVGPRRAGKSVFALQLLKSKHFAYLNFDNEPLLERFDEDLVEQALEEVYPQYEYLMLDEIQNLPSWDLWVSKLYRRGINIVMTGSNAKLLSSEMATVLTGRYLMIEILPFSFQEVVTFNNQRLSGHTPTEKANTMLQLDDYLVYGGFPETLAMRSITQNYLGSLFDSVLLKDVAKRFKVRHTTELYKLASYLLANYTNPVSYSTLVKDLEMNSKITCQKFVGYLTETYMFHQLPRFDNKMRIMQKAPFKMYVVDNGFISSRSFELSPNKGRLLENIVLVELMRRGYKPGFSLFYYRTRNDREIDFVCKQGHQVSALVQVSYDTTQGKTLNREITALNEAARELKCDKKLLLTVYPATQEIEGVEITPVVDWLLAK